LIWVTWPSTPNSAHFWTRCELRRAAPARGRWGFVGAIEQRRGRQLVAADGLRCDGDGLMSRRRGGRRRWAAGAGPGRGIAQRRGSGTRSGCAAAPAAVRAGAGVSGERAGARPGRSRRPVCSASRTGAAAAASASANGAAAAAAVASGVGGGRRRGCAAWIATSKREVPRTVRDCILRRDRQGPLSA